MSPMHSVFALRDVGCENWYTVVQFLYLAVAVAVALAVTIAFSTKTDCMLCVMSRLQNLFQFFNIFEPFEQKGIYSLSLFSYSRKITGSKQHMRIYCMHHQQLIRMNCNAMCSKQFSFLSQNTNTVDSFHLAPLHL